MAPRLSAGKNVSALTINTTNTSRELNSAVVTGNVPADSGPHPRREPVICLVSREGL